MQHGKPYLHDSVETLRFDIRSLGKWAVLSVVIGGLCGVVGTMFHLAVLSATTIREAHPWLLWCLPAFGLCIVALYRVTKTDTLSTNSVIETVQGGTLVNPWLVLSVFVGTALTHLGGGSAGREGAALQMGGTIGAQVGKRMHLGDHDCRTATLCGMAAFFSALFGTPLAATLFAMMVIRVGVAFYSAFLPCYTAALIAFGISLAFGVTPTRFSVFAPELSAWMLLRVAGLGVCCALLAVLFCLLLHWSEFFAKRYCPNAWLRIVFGSFAVIGFSLLVGVGPYNGVSMDGIVQAVEQGKALPWAWAAKMILTVLTLSVGFKGGEVVPCFYVGAAFGCAAGSLLGIPPEFAAALGMIGVFCGATNCLVSSLLLAVELFGGTGILYFGIICGISYALSGYSGLYTSQTFFTSKLQSEYRSEEIENGKG